MDLAAYRVWLRPDGLAYYPIRKAASSSLQHQWKGRPVDMRLVPAQGILKVSLVRSPFDRLASLWTQNKDYPPLRAMGSYKDIPWDEFIDCVCKTKEPYCDHHIWGADHVIPEDCEVFYFEDLDREIDRMNKMFKLNLKLRHFGLTKAAKPEYTTEQATKVARRYRKDLERFYENDTDPVSCRARGKAKAQVRQEDLAGIAGVDSGGGWPAPADYPSE